MSTIAYSKMNDSIIARDVYADDQEDWFQRKQYDHIELDSDLQLSNISYFQLQNESPQINVNVAEARIQQLSKTAATIKKFKPYCGCGQYYSCTSSLYLHIRTKHNGNSPPGTIGGPKGIVKKNYQQLQEQAVKFEDNNGSKFNYYQTQVKKQEKSEVNQVDPNGKEREQQAMISEQVSVDSKPRSKGQITTKTCKICGKIYSCNSSLNLHLKRKHEQRRREDGQIQYEARPQDKQPKNYECSICGLNYGSKSALGLHYNNKHNARNGNSQLPYDEDRIQKCGCGLIYQSRSALNMHVKKKHGGKYPQGTSQKPHLRSKGRTSQNFFIEPEQQEKQVNYDSDSDGKYENQRKINREVPAQRIFRCGCGRNYSCSSSLNLHIKKNHDWKVPRGTIGGPRSMRQLEDKEKPNQINNDPPVDISKEQKTCESCKGQIKSHPYYQCLCEIHHLCNNCFWNQSHIADKQHRWELIEKQK